MLVHGRVSIWASHSLLGAKAVLSHFFALGGTWQGWGERRKGRGHWALGATQHRLEPEVPVLDFLEFELRNISFFSPLVSPFQGKEMMPSLFSKKASHSPSPGSLKFKMEQKTQQGDVAEAVLCGHQTPFLFLLHTQLDEISQTPLQ